MFRPPLALILLVACQEQGVSKYNNAPEVLITSHEDGDLVEPLLPLLLRASVSDPDDGPDSLMATVYQDEDPVCSELMPAEDGTVQCELEIGTTAVEVLVEARDPSNATGTHRIGLEPGDVGDQAPTVNLVDPPSGSQFYDGDPVVLQATVSDALDAPEELALAWASDLDGTLGSDPAAPTGVATLTATALSVGLHTLSLEATDRDGFVGSDAITVEIVDCSRTWYLDLDGDGYGDPEASVEACEPPLDHVDNDEDCDDGEPFVHPDAEELCEDAVDNNCDGRVDEGCLGTNCFEDGSVLADHRYSRFDGELAVDDAASKVGLYRDDFEIEATAGEELAFHLWSEVIDAHLEVYDPDCVRYQDAGDGARGTNAFLVLRVPTDGIWTVVATSGSSEQTGDYVLEMIDDSYTVGLNCVLDTEAFDLLSSPYADSYTGVLDNGDQDFGGGFYYDDIEYYSFYGDTVQVDHSSASFDAILSLYDPDCTLVTYDEDSGAGTDAQVIHSTERTGIYTLTPWAEYSGSTGGYTLSAEASW